MWGARRVGRGEGEGAKGGSGGAKGGGKVSPLGISALST